MPLLASFRSVVMYVQTWMKNSGTVPNDSAFWERFDVWKQTLSPEDVQEWKALTAPRNEDVHVAPIVPAVTTESPHWGPMFPGNYWAGSSVRSEWVTSNMVGGDTTSLVSARPASVSRDDWPLDDVIAGRSLRHGKKIRSSPSAPGCGRILHGDPDLGLLAYDSDSLLFSVSGDR